MNVTLQPELAQFVAEKVRSGEYASADAVLNSAVSLLRDQETLSPEDTAELKREVAIGIEQLKRGQASELNAEEIMAKGRKIFEAKHGKAK